MIRFETPTSDELPDLTALAKKTFIESHGHSAAKEDIDAYLNTHYTNEAFKKELANTNFHYTLCYYNDTLIGFSKIVFDTTTPKIAAQNVAKLERIYVLEKYHGQQIGLALMEYNIELAKQHEQVGVWLFTWTENKRAISFYKKYGFEIIGEHLFKISANHSNPNWQFYLSF
jgi:ribosomal protein S18 acetylase RimI-like enzyme